MLLNALYISHDSMCNWYTQIHNQHGDLSFLCNFVGQILLPLSQTQYSNLSHQKTQCMLSQWLRSRMRVLSPFPTRRMMVINFYWSEFKKETYLTHSIRLCKTLMVKIMKRGGFTVCHAESSQKVKLSQVSRKPG